jgi:hypothetical protein
MSSTSKTLIKLTAFWFLVWGVFVFVLVPKSIDYTNNFIYTSAYFGLVIAFLVHNFRHRIEKFVSDFTWVDAGVIALFFVVSSFSFWAVRTHLVPIVTDMATTPLLTALMPDDRALVAKTFEIVFQQVFFVIIISYIFHSNRFSWKKILAFATYILLIHIPIMLIVPLSFSLILIIGSFVGGMVFSLLITRYKQGFIASFLVHLGFYTILYTGYWLARYGSAIYFN